jgi:uncharacterized protein YabN with tetrapyrrole methylase and pyrophosphatase domain
VEVVVEAELKRENGKQAGNLTVIGTGIRTVGQLTVESLAWMRSADELLHVVADPVAEEVMRSFNPRSRSLQYLYGEGKPRMETYNEMVEAILAPVREGKAVCAAFYGHPGVFAYPSHESIRRARREGYSAQMLPGVSAEDCLFADLGVDPAIGGCQSYEATDFVMNGRICDPSSQLVLWQVGALGDWTYRRDGYNLRAFPLLLQRLLELHPPFHEVVIYEAAVFPGCQPRIDRIPLYALNATQVTPSSTMYLPPSRNTVPDARYAPLLAQVGTVA